MPAEEFNRTEVLKQVSQLKTQLTTLKDLKFEENRWKIQQQIQESIKSLKLYESGRIVDGESVTDETIETLIGNIQHYCEQLLTNEEIKIQFALKQIENGEKNWNEFTEIVKNIDFLKKVIQHYSKILDDNNSDKKAEQTTEKIEAAQEFWNIFEINPNLFTNEQLNILHIHNYSSGIQNSTNPNFKKSWEDIETTFENAINKAEKAQNSEELNEIFQKMDTLTNGYSKKQAELFQKHLPLLNKDSISDAILTYYWNQQDTYSFTYDAYINPFLNAVEKINEPKMAINQEAIEKIEKTAKQYALALEEINYFIESSEYNEEKVGAEKADRMQTKYIQLFMKHGLPYFNGVTARIRIMYMVEQYKDKLNYKDIKTFVGKMKSNQRWDTEKYRNEDIQRLIDKKIEQRHHDERVKKYEKTKEIIEDKFIDFLITLIKKEDRLEVFQAYFENKGELSEQKSKEIAYRVGNGKNEVLSKAQMAEFLINNKGYKFSEMRKIFKKAFPKTKID